MTAAKWERWRDPEGLALLEGWARLGLSEEQIIRNMGVSRATLRAWKQRFPEVEAALRRGREAVDFQVESALLRRALGFTYGERRVETNEKGGEKIVEITKESLPDISAQKFWLQNRRPDLWRERGGQDESEADGAEAGVILLGDVLPEEDLNDNGGEGGGDG